jgi:hypothetical protein
LKKILVVMREVSAVTYMCEVPDDFFLSDESVEVLVATGQLHNKIDSELQSDEILDAFPIDAFHPLKG